jgi:hypothetical protein
MPELIRGRHSGWQGKRNFETTRNVAKITLLTFGVRLLLNKNRKNKVVAALLATTILWIREIILATILSKKD